MENKINIAELLKDCPKGMELDCTICNGVKFIELDRNPNFPIVVRAGNGYNFTLTKYGQVHNIDDATCVIFPKGKKTWEGFVPPCQFKDGDVLVHTQNDRFVMSIYKSNESKIIINTYAIFWDREEGLSVGMQICCYTDSTRLATEEEKKKLFQAIKDNGYRWNAETKTLEKLIVPKFKIGDRIKWKGHDASGRIEKIEDNVYHVDFGYDDGVVYVGLRIQDDYELVPNKFDISSLIPFESRVLFRNTGNDIWKPAIFGCYLKDKSAPYYALGGTCWRYCIPFDANEHLLGTEGDCDEYYKNWK